MWEHSYTGLQLAQLLGQLGVFLSVARAQAGGLLDDVHDFVHQVGRTLILRSRDDEKVLNERNGHNERLVNER